ncbi:hypothetical protein IT570_03580 [Candidatus Sumerlaeota bacterium]|nr:hypothetical protein [Candidatus Sumerlaeota bacterium]
MADQIQGREVSVKIYQAGKLIAGIPAKTFSHEADAEIRKRELLGERRSAKQLLIDGFKGSIGFDVESKRHMELDRYLNESDKSGAPAYVFAIQVREQYRDGSASRVRFTDVIFMPPKINAKGRRDDLEGTLDWEAKDKSYLD